MFIQHPIYGIFISFFITFLIVTESIQREKLLKKRLIISFVNLAVFIVFIFFYDRYIKDQGIFDQIYMYYNFANYFFFLITLYSTFKNAIIKSSHYNLFIKGIKKSHWNTFYVVDKNERIKDISQSLLSEINLEKEDVVGKKLFQIFDKKIRFTKLNDENINNRTLEKIFDDYKREAKVDDQIEQELHFLNYNGETVILQLITQPVFVLGKYRGRISIGQKKSDFDLLSVEKQAKQKDDELESIRYKFIATLELSDEGLFSIDLDNKTIWLNDALVESLNLNNHTLPLSDFRTLIEPTDINKYLTKISDLSISNQTYTVSYRILVNGTYIWVKEKGKRIFEDRNKSVIMGVISLVNNQHFRKTEIEALDEIKSENHLIIDLKNLIKTQRPFQLAILSLSNVPDINDQHGREIGNMIMGQYIMKLKKSFVTQSSDIYRITGLEFALTITDPRKMVELKQGLLAKEDFLNLHMEYGSIHTHLEVFIGIASMYDDAVNAQDLYQNAKRALKTSMLPQFKGHGCYFKDIK